jgi:hypothetical protein
LSRSPAISLLGCTEFHLLSLSFQELDKEDRKIVLNLMKRLKEREDAMNGTIPVIGNE